MRPAISANKPPAAREASASRFSIYDFPEGDRLEACREILGRAVMNLEIERLPDSRFSGEITTMRALPGLYMSNGAVVGMQFRRTPALIDSDDLIFHLSFG